MTEIIYECFNPFGHTIKVYGVPKSTVDFHFMDKKYGNVKKNKLCFPQKKESYIGLDPHESEYTIIQTFQYDFKIFLKWLYDFENLLCSPSLH